MNPLINLLQGAAQGAGQIYLAPGRLNDVMDLHGVSKAPLHSEVKRRPLFLLPARHKAFAMRTDPRNAGLFLPAF